MIVREKIRKLGREIEERIDEDNKLEDKITRDHHLLLLPSKRLESH